MNDERAEDNVVTVTGAAGIEARLRAWRPVGPPPALRVRVLAAPTPGRVWPWAAAAAALLLCTLGLRVAADALLTQAAARLTTNAALSDPGAAPATASASTATSNAAAPSDTEGRSDPAAAVIASLADALGGDDAARRTATQVVRAEERRVEQQRQLQQPSSRADPADAGLPPPMGDMP
jgi:hypothetical protein